MVGIAQYTDANGNQWNKTVPITKGTKFNTSVTANTNIFAASLSPTVSPTVFRIYCCFDAVGMVKIQRTFSAVTVAETLNLGASLLANVSYMFDFLVDPSETINIQYTANATALKISVVEIAGDA